MPSSFYTVKHFKDCLELYRAYYRKHDSLNSHDFNRDLAMEVDERLTNLDYVLDEVMKSESRVESIQARSRAAFENYVKFFKAQKDSIAFDPPKEAMPTHEEYKEISKLWVEIEIKTEYFYFSAFRTRCIIRQLPDLTTFESVGVRDVRNKLIEHPDKDRDSQILIRSFGFGNKEKGPVIKAIRYSNQVDVFPDSGLYVNARQFKEKLEVILKAAVI